MDRKTKKQKNIYALTVHIAARLYIIACRFAKNIYTLAVRLAARTYVNRAKVKFVAIAMCICMVIVSIPLSVTLAATSKRVGTRLTSSSVGTTLSSGTYYVDSNITIKSSDGPGLDIAENSTVYLYIDKGKTLTCIGADGYCSEVYINGDFETDKREAGAGIHLPETSTLILMGSGTVTAEGGDGYANTSGHNAKKGSYHRSKNASESYVTSGKGGTGGVGAGSPGTGIGGNGVNGTDGAKQTTRTLKGSKKDEVTRGKKGSSEDGDQGESMGTLYVWDSVIVNATTGAVKNNFDAGGGKGADAVYSSYDEYKGTDNKFRLVAAACGGGSAGGWVNSSSYDIGGSNGGGGGGASGATGAIANMRKSGGWRTFAYFGLVSSFSDEGDDGGAAVSGCSGALWDYDGGHYFYGSAPNGSPGERGDGGEVYTYSSAIVNKKKTNSKEDNLVKVSINLLKDDKSNTQWSKEQSVTLWQKEKNGNMNQVYELFNCDFSNGKTTGTYYYEIPASTGTLYIYVNGISTGQTVNVGSNNVTTDVNAYTTTVNLSGNMSPKQNSTVRFYDEGNLAYAFEEVSAGVYEATVVYRPNSGDNNKYEIYVDGESVQKWLDFSKNNRTIDINFYDLNVYITEDGVNTGGVGVTLWRNSKLCYTLKELSDRSYTYRMIAESGAEEASGKYDIYVNGADSGKDIDFSSTATLTAEVPYITLSVTLRKDGESWYETTVNVTDSAGNEYLLSNKGAGLYEKLLPADTYTVSVAGITGNAKASDILSESAKSMSQDYYTVTYHRNYEGLENLDIYQTYILRSGENIKVPTKPSVGGANFAFWSDSADSTTDSDSYDFTQKVTQKTDLYAIWDMPTVVIGEEVRTDASGTTNGSGAYYEMKNLVISGFADDYVITNIQLDYTNISSLKLTQTVSGCKQTTTVGTNTEKTSTNRTLLHFTNPITVEQAQNILRNIVIQPTANTQHTMQVTVYTEPQ